MSPRRDRSASYARDPRSVRDPGRPTVRRALAAGAALATAGLLGVPALARVFVYSARGQALDARVMSGFTTGDRTDNVLLSGLETVSVGAVVLALVVLALFGALRRRADLALAAAALVAGSNVTTQLVKSVLDREDHGIGYWGNSLPSGHTTVITSLGLALALVLPVRWRRLMVPLATLAAAGGGIATVVLAWHRPSDVLAAYAVVLAWSGVAVIGMALLRGVRGRVPGTRDRAPTYVAGAALAALLVGGLLLAGVDPSAGRWAWLFSLGAMGVLAVAAAVCVGLSTYAFDLLGDGDRGDGERGERGVPEAGRGGRDAAREWYDEPWGGDPR